MGGDTSAFLPIVQATQDRLVRLSARLLGSVSEAEDVVQEAYLKAYRSLVGGRFDRRSQVTTWLHRIVVNATLDARRARSRTRTTPSETPPEASTDGSASTEARVALRELAGWLGALPEEQQVVLVLKVFEDLSSAEVAAIVGCSEGAVEQRLVRARAALRKMEGES
jgi:RNA polymerase sigma-70 factor (ECF subfamily)